MYFKYKEINPMTVNIKSYKARKKWILFQWYSLKIRTIFCSEQIRRGVVAVVQYVLSFQESSQKIKKTMIFQSESFL